MENNKETISITIDKKLHKRFKMRLLELDLNNKSAKIEELIINWLKENK